MSTLLVVLLVLLCVGALPNTGWHSYGWGPSSLVGLLVIVLIILLLTGRL